MKKSITSLSSAEEVKRYYDSTEGKTWGDSYSLDQEGRSTNPAVLRLNLLQRLMKLFPCNDLLDAGCADAVVVCRLLEQGLNVTGVDFSAQLIALGKDRLRAQGHDPERIAEGDVTDLSRFPDGSFGGALCLGVLPHIDPMERAIAELARVTKPGGFLFLSFRNDLFDLFTFNKYTVEFFQENILPHLPAGEEEKEKALEAVKGLMVNPDLPKDRSDTFGQITRINSNPLTMAEDCSRFGLALRKTGYYKFHPLPPLVSGQFPDYVEWGAALDEKLSLSWEGAFMASTFVSVFEKL